MAFTVGQNHSPIESDAGRRFDFLHGIHFVIGEIHGHVASSHTVSSKASGVKR